MTICRTTIRPRLTLSGMEMVVTRTGFTGEKGFEIYLKNSRRDGMKLWNTMLEAGRPFGLRPTGSAVPRRLEAGIKNFRQDITHDDNPYEVGLQFTVDLEKESDFIGKRALKKIQEEGGQAQARWHRAIRWTHEGYQ